MFNHPIRLAPMAPMPPDPLHQIASPSVMQEEHPLPHAPQRRRPKLIRPRATLCNSVCQSLAHVVYQQVRIKIRLLIRKRHARAGRKPPRNHGPRGKRRRMAMRASNLRKRRLPPLARRRRSRGSRRRQHPHKIRKPLNIRKPPRARPTAAPGSSREMQRVLRSRIEQAPRRLIALLREQLARHSHLHVVRLARKQQQRLVLRLPTESRNRPVVRVAVHVPAQVRVRMSVNSHRRFSRRVRLHVRKDRRIRNGFDQPRPKYGRRYTENNVRIPALPRKRISCGQEVRLRNVATNRVGSTGDHKKVVYLAVGCSVGPPLKPRLAHRPLRRDKPRHGILRPIKSGNRDLRIVRRARSTLLRLRVARHALVGIKSRAQPLRHAVYFREPRLPILEKRRLVRRKPLQWSAGSCRPTPHARIDWPRFTLPTRANTQTQRRNHHNANTRAHPSAKCNHSRLHGLGYAHCTPSQLLTTQKGAAPGRLAPPQSRSQSASLFGRFNDLQGGSHHQKMKTGRVHPLSTYGGDQESALEKTKSAPDPFFLHLILGA